MLGGGGGGSKNVKVFLLCLFQKAQNFVGRVAVQKQKFGPLWATVDEKDVPKPLYSEDILHPCLGLVRPGSTLHPLCSVVCV